MNFGFFLIVGAVGQQVQGSFCRGASSGYPAFRLSMLTGTQEGGAMSFLWYINNWRIRDVKWLSQVTEMLSDGLGV